MQGQGKGRAGKRQEGGGDEGVKDGRSEGRKEKKGGKSRPRGYF